MKVKVGLDPVEDVARVAAVRQAVGPDVRLGVDANGGWSVRTAIQTIQQLYQLGLSLGGQDPVSLRHDYETEVCRIPCQHADQLHLYQFG